MRRGLLLTLALAGVVAAAAAPVAQAQAPSLEYPVKAAFLSKFAPFVEWSAGVFPAANTPLQICIAGDDPFGPLMDQAVLGQPGGVRPMTVRRMEVLARGSGCHIAYVAGSRAQTIADALKQVRGEPILTVTDASRDGMAKGIVHFVVVGNRVRFEIDGAGAMASGLTISSKLMSLAIRRRP